MNTNKQPFWSIVRGYWWVALLPAAVVMPGHWGHSLHEARFGQNFWSVLTTSVASDMLYATWAFGLAAALPALTRNATARRWLTFGATLAVGLGLWLFTIIAMEFRIHRGLQMTLYDVSTAKGDSGFLISSIPTLWQARYGVGNVIAIVALALSMVAIMRATRPAALASTRRRVHVAAIGTLGALATFAGFQYFAQAKVFLPGMVDRSDYRSSLVTFFKGARQYGARTRGFRTIIESTVSPWSEVAQGARMFGWDGAPPSEVDTKVSQCGPHPIARHFPIGREASPAGASPLERDLASLGMTINSQGRPLIVWHVMIESVRADEVHAINPKADPRVTPWLNDLFAHGGETNDETRDLALLAPRNWGSGARSSQSLAGMLCGIGMYPFTFSAARDLGNLPLRCVQDILKDAGFTTRVYFGSSLAFDEKRRFYRYHGQETREGVDAPPGMVPGAWGITDLSLSRWVVDEVSGDYAARPRSMHVLITTVSNHPPFELPSDAPADMARRLTDVATEHQLEPADAKRLTTIAYTDLALSDIVARVRAAGLMDRSVFFLTHDHATAEPPVWEAVNSLNHPAARRAGFQIPMSLVFPREFVAAATRPAEFRRALAAVNRRLASMDISQNDQPRLLLEVLARSGALDSLPKEWRWHNLGGQILSRGASFGPYPQSIVWGMDAHARLELIDQDGKFIPVKISSWPPPPGTEDLMPHAGIFAPMLSATGFLLRSGMACPIRMHE